MQTSLEGSSERIRVLIVDDHPVVRIGLKTMLESEGGIAVAGMAGCAAEAIMEFQRAQPDVVLMDLRMPEVEGVQAILELRRIEPGVRVLVLTNYESEEDILRALQAGAMGYMLKSTPQEEVMEAVEMIHQNRRYIPPRIAQRLSEAIAYEELSHREHEVLSLVAKGFTNKEIAQRLFISDKTARNHVTSCLLKLGANDRTEAVTKAIGRGLLRIAE
jgi:DNA-binding NarL/FixJ family response regulator